MEEKYYLETRPRQNGIYFIHRFDCPFLPRVGKRICLGTFAAPEQAAMAGTKYIKNTCGCLFCMKDQHVTKVDIQEGVPAEKPVFIKTGAIRVTWENACVCGVN